MVRIYYFNPSISTNSLGQTPEEKKYANTLIASAEADS
jgi:hypothetical protein